MSMFRRCNLFMVAASILIVGCGGSDAVAPADVEKQAWEDLRVEVRAAIDDSERKAEVLRLVDSLQEDLGVLRERVAERQRRSKELNANYDTSRADYDAFFAKINLDLRQSQREVGETRRAFLAAMTPEEWELIAKARSKAMNAVMTSVRSI